MSFESILRRPKTPKNGFVITLQPIDGFGQNSSSVGYWIRGIDITTLLVPSEGPKKAHDLCGVAHFEFLWDIIDKSFSSVSALL